MIIDKMIKGDPSTEALLKDYGRIAMEYQSLYTKEKNGTYDSSVNLEGRVPQILVTDPEVVAAAIKIARENEAIVYRVSGRRYSLANLADFVANLADRVPNKIFIIEANADIQASELKSLMDLLSSHGLEHVIQRQGVGNTHSAE